MLCRKGERGVKPEKRWEKSSEIIERREKYQFDRRLQSGHMSHDLKDDFVLWALRVRVYMRTGWSQRRARMLQVQR